MYFPSQPVAAGYWAVIETTAPSLALHTAKIPVRTADDTERAIVALAREPNGGLFMMGGGVTIPHQAYGYLPPSSKLRPISACWHTPSSSCRGM